MQKRKQNSVKKKNMITNEINYEKSIKYDIKNNFTVIYIMQKNKK